LEEEKAKRQDIHGTVAQVRSALAPFLLLPMVESLSQITGRQSSLCLQSRAKLRSVGLAVEQDDLFATGRFAPLVVVPAGI
jgi:hypothetical protein